MTAVGTMTKKMPRRSRKAARLAVAGLILDLAASWLPLRYWGFGRPFGNFFPPGASTQLSVVLFLTHAVLPSLSGVGLWMLFRGYRPTAAGIFLVVGIMHVTLGLSWVFVLSQPLGFEAHLLGLRSFLLMGLRTLAGVGLLLAARECMPLRTPPPPPAPT